MAGPSQNVELEAAKFLHKLIQDSKDEPAKLATKLYVILQHMRSSGKEHSMPYQVISRAMETVINQHGLDIEALKSSRLPMASGTQAADSATTQFGGPSQPAGVAKDAKVGLPENELSKMDPFAASKPPLGPSSAGHDYFQGPGTHQNTQSFDHESPSSLDSRSANSQSQERRDTAKGGKQTNQKDGKKTATKRKRGDTSVPTEPPSDISQQPESRNTRKGKMGKVESSSGSALKGGEHGNFNIHPGSNPMEQFASMSSSGRPGLRPKQEGQTLVEKQLDPANNSTSRVPNSKFPEEMEVNSTQNQQMPAVAHDNMGLRNQNKSGMQFEKPQVPRFSSNVVPGNPENPLQPAAPSLGTGSFGKFHGGLPGASGSFPAADPGFSNPMQFGGSNLTTGKGLEHDGGGSNNLVDAGKLAQAGRQNSAAEMGMLRNAAPRDTGKSPVGSGMPFREQQLKQLRAQCLVFLAFRNCLIPKKMHLDIALGSTFLKEGGSADGSRKELVDHKGKVPSSSNPNNVLEAMTPFGRANNAMETDKIPPGTSSAGRFEDTDPSSKEAGNQKVDDKNGALSEERKHLQTSRKPDVELQTQDTSGMQQDSSGSKSGLVVGAPGDNMENGHPLVGRTNQGISMMAANSWTAVGNHDMVSRGVLPVPSVQQNLVPEGKDNATGQIQNLGNMGSLVNQHPDNNISSLSLRDRWKPVSGIDNNHHAVGPLKDANMMPKHVHREQREEDNFIPTELSPSPKYTMSDKWIMDYQKKKHMKDQKWLLKLQKTRHRIATCFYKLKENANSSEDISAKTKSVIELKKLQLLELQRRLRSDFLNDFFKPISVEVDRLKSCKKHKHGRRVKQLEKFEQKMKEERQKRIRERQKEFFGEIEVHKERLDDVFKFKRERLKGFNKYAKEFHKRKERIHREKIDRIQREKINLLKINDVEGYLRMVQDAKSDRVKQLLKETEKYLQKLGSKLQEAKHAGDGSGPANIVDKSETATENEDESDQAKHYLESNEKYYLMAHSVKESIAEQPSILQGGKLREYQMNGLRWLVSLYNNHLNGILADEMGLGKTVQVISLICYLMETKNDRGPFLVVVPSSVLPGWESEINFWAPSVNKIVYSGPPEERRRLFKERIVHQKFNVLLTTYEYLMNKHDRPKLSKIHWHYVIIDEGHRIKNASCKLNSDLKHYQSSHRLLLTGTPLQNNLDELWALLNFLLPNIFNSSEDFSQWFNKPFESNGDNSADQALLSEEENLLIINRLHQVLRPFVLRRLKHKVENELPEKIERLIRCEASAYQKLLMKRVEDNLGSIGSTKVRSVHNSVMELRNICNHPYLSQLHAEEVDNYLPKHYLPPIIRHCGKLEMLDRLLPKLKATDHRVLFFSTMTRLLDVMEEYLHWKQYPYLRLDGHTSGGDRGALIEAFNKTESPYFIFLLSIRAGGVGVNLQAADTVIIFDTDWNPQVDLQAQARAHRIGQKRDVLVLRFETVQTVEEQVRASAEHKLGVANQSITAGFFDNNTSAEDRREYLEALLRECKKEEAAPVLDDDALNDILARSESEIDVFESVDKQRRDAEMATWRKLGYGQGQGTPETLPLLPSRLVTEDDLKEFCEAMKIYEVPKAPEVPSIGGVKRKGASLGGLDTQHYGRGKRTREVRSYEEQWTEEEFEKMCQVESPESPSKPKEEVTDKKLPTDSSQAAVASSQDVVAVVKTEIPVPAIPQPPLPTVSPLPTILPQPTVQPPPPTVQPPPPTVQQPPPTVQQPPPTVEQPPPAVQQPSLPVPQPLHLQQTSEVTPPAKRGRGRPKRATVDKSPSAVVQTPGTGKADAGLPKGTPSQSITNPESSPIGVGGNQVAEASVLSSQPITPPAVAPGSQAGNAASAPAQGRGQGRRAQSATEAPRRRGKRQGQVSPVVPVGLVSPDPKPTDVSKNDPVKLSGSLAPAITETAASFPTAQVPPDPSSVSYAVQGTGGTDLHPGVGAAVNSLPALQPVAPGSVSSPPSQTLPIQTKGQGRKTQSGSGARRRGRKQTLVSAPVPLVSAGDNLKPTPETQNKFEDSSQAQTMTSKQDNAQEPANVIQEQAVCLPDSAGQDAKTTEQTVDTAQGKQNDNLTTTYNGPALGESQSADAGKVATVLKEALPENSSCTPETSEHLKHEGVVASAGTLLDKTLPEVSKNQYLEDKTVPVSSPLSSAASGGVPSTSFSSSAPPGGITHHIVPTTTAISPQPVPIYSTVPPVTHSAPHPPELGPTRRSGRKTPIRAETPRRRGRRQASVSPMMPDAPASQDPGLSSQSQSRSVDAVGSKSVTPRGKQGTDAQELTNIVKAQPSVATHDLKKKDQSSHTASIKQPVNPPATVDSAAGSSDRISAKGRIQTADVNDVARVMKEVFSGTRLSKSKATESSAKEGRAAPTVSSSRQTAPEVAKNLILEDKVHSDPANMDMGAPGFPLKYGKQSVIGAGSKAEVDSTISNETQNKTTDVSTPEIKITTISEKNADPGQPSQENAIKVNTTEGVCDAPLVGEKHDGISEGQPLVADPSITLETSNELSTSSTAMELDVNQNDSVKKTEPLSDDPPKSPHPNVRGVECPDNMAKEKAADSSGTTTPPLHDSSSHGDPQILHQLDDVSDNVNLGDDCSDKSDFPPVESQAVKSTGESVVAGPEFLSKAEVHGVGPESANINSMNSSLHDASLTEGNRDFLSADIVTKGDEAPTHLDLIITKDGNPGFIKKYHICRMQVDRFEGDKSSSSDVAGTVSGNSEAGGSSSLAAEEKVDDYERSAVGSSTAPEEPKGPFVECNDKLDVSNTSGCVSESTTEPLPVSSSVDVENKIDGSNEMGVACSLSPSAEMSDVFVSRNDTEILPEKASEHSSLISGEAEKETNSAVPAEAPKDSEADMDIQFNSSIGQQNSLEKSPEPSSPTVKDCSLASTEEAKGSEPEIPIPLDSSSAEVILPEKALEISPSSVPGEKVGYPSQMDTVQSRVPVQELKDSEAKMHIHLNPSASDVILSEKMADPLSSQQAAEEKIESAPERELVCSLSLEEPKNSESEMVVESGSYDVGVSASEETMPGPLPSVVMGEENMKGSDEKDLPCSVVQLEGTKESEAEKDDQPLKGSEDSDHNIVPAESSQVGSILLESAASDKTSLPLPSSVKDDEKVKGPAEKGPEELSVQLEGSNDVETKMQSTTDACDIHECEEMKDSETLALPSSSSVSEEANTEDSTVKSLVDASQSLNELKCYGSDSENIVDEDFHAGGDSSLLVNTAATLRAEEGANASPSKHPVGDAIQLTEVEDSGNQVTDQMDASQGDIVTPRSMTGTSVLPSSLLTRISSEESPVSCTVAEEETKVAETEFSEQMDVCEFAVDTEKQEAQEKLTDLKAEFSDQMDVCEDSVDMEKQEAEERLKDLKAEFGDQMDVCEDSVDTEKQEAEEKLKDPKAEFSDQMDVCEVSVDAEKQEAEEKVKDSSEECPGGSTVPKEESKTPMGIVETGVVTEKQEAEEKLHGSSEESPDEISGPLDGSSSHGTRYQMDEPEAVGSPLKDTIVESADQPSSTQRIEGIEGSSEKNRASSPVLDKVGHPASPPRGNEVDDSEKNQASSPVSEKVNPPSSALENEELEGLSQTHQASSLVSEKVDPLSSAQQNEEIESSSEKHQASSLASEKVDLPSLSQKIEDIEGSSERQQTSSPVSEKVDPPPSVQETEEIDGSSEKHQASSPMKVDLPSPSSSHKTEDVEGSSEKHQASNPVCENVDPPLSAQENQEIDGSSEKHQASSPVPEKVDFPSSSHKNEDIEGSSEKYEASSPVPEKVDPLAEKSKEIDGSPEKYRACSPVSEKVELPSSSQKTDDIEGSSEPVSEFRPSSTQQNDEIEVSSEKNEASSSVAVAESEVSEVEVADRIDTSEASAVLPKTNVPSNSDTPISSAAAEEKPEERDDLTGGLVSAASQQGTTEPANQPDGPEDCKTVVLDNVPESIDQSRPLAPEGSDDPNEPEKSVEAPENSEPQVKS